MLECLILWYREVITTCKAFPLSPRCWGAACIAQIPFYGKLNQLFEPLKTYKFHHAQPICFNKCQDPHFHQAIIPIYPALFRKFV